MKLKTTTTILAIALCAVISPVAGSEPAVEKRIAFIDDFTDFPANTVSSLQKSHVDSLMQSIAGTTAAISYIAVAGDATKQKLVSTVIPGFSEKRPHSSNLEGMTLEELLQEKKRLTKEMLSYQHSFELWKGKALSNSGVFQEKLFREQIETLNRFESDEFDKRSDYRRSDVAGTVIRAAELFRGSAQSRDYMILATDGVDVPSNQRTARTRQFSAAELPSHVVLIFVSSDGTPENQPLFRDLPNPKHKLTSLDEVVPFLKQCEELQNTPSTTSTR